MVIQFPDLIYFSLIITQELISVVSFKVLFLGRHTGSLIFMPPSFKALLEVHCVRLNKCILQFFLIFVMLKILLFNGILNSGKRKKSCGTKHGEYGGCGMTFCF